MSITVAPKFNRLTWKQFKPVASIPGSSEEAQISSQTSQPRRLRPEKTSNGRFRLPSYTIAVGIDPNQTLVLKSANQTNELLQHEQGHYDLLILLTRALARKLESLDGTSPEDLGAKVDEATTRHAERAEAIDDRYDLQTDHGRNRTMQLRWDAAIAHASGDPKALERFEDSKALWP
jgi:predicted secreted Zn-dependent protease